MFIIRFREKRWRERERERERCRDRTNKRPIYIFKTILEHEVVYAIKIKII